jgi:hypothetical protein
MKNNELKVNQMEQATGGNFLDTAKEILKEIFPDRSEPKKPHYPTMPDIIAAK